MLFTHKRRRPQIGAIELDNKVISEVTSHVNLGLLITNNLSWKDHVTMLADKAHRRLNVIARYRHKIPRSALERLYVTMVRPVIEYGDVIYDTAPHSTARIADRVQRRAALICTGAYRHSETQSLLRELSWQPLSKRRHSHKLVIFYKIYHHIYPQYLYNLIPPTNTIPHNLRHTQELRLPHTRLQATQNSFFPATAKVWNTLSPPVKNSVSAQSFKNKINVGPPPPETYTIHFALAKKAHG